jgi:hyperosmotically inducible protein
MKPICWRCDPALTTLSLTLLLLAVSACDSGGLRTAEGARAARAAAETTRAASVIAAAQLATPNASSAAVPAPAAPAAAASAQPLEQDDDALITAKVTTGLAIDRTLRSSHIEVATRGGVVTLKGPAPSAAARARAEEIARNVQGVTSVENRLRVVTG